jgi:hypothetical protein
MTRAELSTLSRFVTKVLAADALFCAIALLAR